MESLRSPHSWALCNMEAMMNFEISIDELFSFDANNSHSLGSSFSQKLIPNTPGVYIIHNGPLEKSLWDGIFYIGATNKFGLRKRAEMHRNVLMDLRTKHGTPKTKGSKSMISYAEEKLKNDASNVYFSFFGLDQSTPEFMAFLYEGFIINEFEKKFGFKPMLNTGG
jgi:hypothetical protein